MKIYIILLTIISCALEVPISSYIFYPPVHNIAVIGSAGYVGLVTAACLARDDQHVIGADIDAAKVDMLNKGISPFYEPGLDELLQDIRYWGKHLSFTTDCANAIRCSDIIFIAVGTPMSDDGSADLSYVKAVAALIRDNLNDYKVVCIKSTVPVGTSVIVKSIISQNSANIGKFDMVSNPEFLREGSAIHDFQFPDRIVIGAESQKAFDYMREIYYPYVKYLTPNRIETDIATAETIKYASNAFLAIKLSFINEMSRFADATGADIKKVAEGMGTDPRINPYFLNPGPGFGGSCFPKDSNALVHMANQHAVDMKVVRASLDANKAQRQYVIAKLMPFVDNNLEGKVIAVLGLAFKAGTDDVREAPALDIITKLKQHKAIIQAYDPIAMANAKKIIPDISYSDSVQKAVTGADAIIILTEWQEFKKLDFKQISGLVKNKVIIDARNLYNPQQLKDAGFAYDTMGRGRLA